MNNDERAKELAQKSHEILNQANELLNRVAVRSSKLRKDVKIIREQLSEEIASLPIK
jgi:hypothetical protein